MPDSTTYAPSPVTWPTCWPPASPTGLPQSPASGPVAGGCTGTSSATPRPDRRRPVRGVRPTGRTGGHPAGLDGARCPGAPCPAADLRAVAAEGLGVAAAVSALPPAGRRHRRGPAARSAVAGRWSRRGNGSRPVRWTRRRATALGRAARRGQSQGGGSVGQAAPGTGRLRGAGDGQRTAAGRDDAEQLPHPGGPAPRQVAAEVLVVGQDQGSRNRRERPLPRTDAPPDPPQPA